MVKGSSGPRLQQPSRLPTASVDDEVMARDEVRGLTGEINHRAVQVLHLGHAVRRRVAQPDGLGHARAGCVGHLGAGVAGADGVDPAAVRRPFGRGVRALLLPP